MKHTKGPWYVANDVDVRGGPQEGQEYVSTARARGRTLDEARANARLIAAAPDLLTACEEALAGADSDGLKKRLAAAIAKIHGT
jgi:hypothetical protein